MSYYSNFPYFGTYHCELSNDVMVRSVSGARAFHVAIMVRHVEHVAFHAHITRGLTSKTKHFCTAFFDDQVFLILPREEGLFLATCTWQAMNGCSSIGEPRLISFGRWLVRCNWVGIFQIWVPHLLFWLFIWWRLFLLLFFFFKLPKNI